MSAFSPKVSTATSQIRAMEINQARQRVSLVDLLNPSSMYPVFNSLRASLDACSILNLTSTCKRLHSLRHYLWDINRSLRRFVDDPMEFRSQMGAADGLISGSFVLQFFEGVFWEESDLDVFIRNDGRERAFAAYLIHKESYECINPVGSDAQVDPLEYEMKGDFKVLTYLRKSSNNTTHYPKIQIIVTKDLPIFRILQSFYTTCVVNVISWNKAYAIYARPTFAMHKTYCLRSVDDTIGALLRKYSDRGWQSHDVLWPEEARSPLNPFRTPRRVGDSFTWTLPLSTTGIRTSKTPDSVLEYSQFGFAHTNDTTNIDAQTYSFQTCYGVEILPFRAHVLRYDYTFTSSDSGWCFYLGERVDRLTYLELRKMRPEDRPEEFEQSISRDGEPQTRCLYTWDFEKPAWWTYYDAQIPEWYKQYEEDQVRAKGLFPDSERRVSRGR
ncbi:hypothetical protein BU16DRAFT_531300 [Lophium mytilinum]|uniref:Uncharacterized protein n=1 Tax=Lophium mytilinum TaxID=390894 RepID=A0A6A6QBM3_9PEZI|nr:hypothetical protein BU16DRAFT_531300 [Lophium mytilinum]